MEHVFIHVQCQEDDLHTQVLPHGFPGHLLHVIASGFHVEHREIRPETRHQSQCGFAIRCFPYHFQPGIFLACSCAALFASVDDLVSRFILENLFIHGGRLSGGPQLSPSCHGPAQTARKLGPQQVRSFHHSR